MIAIFIIPIFFIIFWQDTIKNPFIRFTIGWLLHPLLSYLYLSSIWTGNWFWGVFLLMYSIWACILYIIAWMAYAIYKSSKQPYIEIKQNITKESTMSENTEIIIKSVLGIGLIIGFMVLIDKLL